MLGFRVLGLSFFFVFLCAWVCHFVFVFLVEVSELRLYGFRV